VRWLEIDLRSLLWILGQATVCREGSGIDRTPKASFVVRLGPQDCARARLSHAYSTQAARMQDIETERREKKGDGARLGPIVLSTGP